MVFNETNMHDLLNDGEKPLLNCFIQPIQHRRLYFIVYKKLDDIYYKYYNIHLERFFEWLKEKNVKATLRELGSVILNDTELRKCFDDNFLISNSVANIEDINLITSIINDTEIFDNYHGELDGFSAYFYECHSCQKARIWSYCAENKAYPLILLANNFMDKTDITDQHYRFYHIEKRA